MSLAHFQDMFADYLFNADSELEPIGLPMIDAKTDYSKQFELYRERALANLHEQLLRVYPITRTLLTQPEFRAASDEYFSKSMPSAIDPMKFAKDFPEFLADFPTEKDLPYLVDVAMLDFGCYQSHQAMDATPTKSKIFTELTPDQLASRRVQLHPACFWMSSSFAIYDFWQRHHAKTRSATSSNTMETQEVVIIRPKFTVEVHKVDTGLVKTLDALDAGQTLNEALMEGSLADAKFNAVGAIQFMIQNGLIVTLY